MTSILHAEKFAEMLKVKLLSIGAPKEMAEAISKKVKPVKKNGSLVVAQCSDDFQTKLFVNSLSSHIEEIARDCWGAETKIALSHQTSVQTTPAPAPRPRKRKTSTNAGTERLFFSAEEQEESKASDSIAEPAIETRPKETASFVETPSDRSFGATSEAFHQRPSNLQGEFKFDNFVRGQSNMMAYTACESVANEPGKLSNPLFIFGATGLGKTHLLQAVGNRINANHPHWKIIFMSSQDFTNELVNSIRHSKTDLLRKKYHSADVLLVDDIQFLENKAATQAEFFTLFNELCRNKKQIVITSDKAPKDIPNIEDRLKSRFVQGLIADVEPPGLEDRIAIIEAKANDMNLNLAKDVVEHIAHSVRNNVREIQGALQNLVLAKNMHGKDPTIQSTNEVLRSFVRLDGPSIDSATIQKIVAQHFSLKVSELTSPKRDKRLVFPRHIAMYLTKDLMNIALKEIAECFHRKDHTTVQHAIRKTKELLKTDESTRATIRELKRKLEHAR